MISTPDLQEKQEKAETKAQVRTDRIYQHLRRCICLLDYPPGTILREHDLAADFDVSRTPIRRVLHWLERDGLVESRQGVGTTVTSVDLEDLLETYMLRARLAASIADTRIIPPREEVFSELERLGHECNELMQKFDMRHFGEVNIGLHTQLIAIIGSRGLREMTDYLYYRTTRIWFGLLNESNWHEEVYDMKQESSELAEAMRIGDYRTVGQIRRNHVAGVRVRIRLRFACDAKDA